MKKFIVFLLFCFILIKTPIISSNKIIHLNNIRYYSYETYTRVVIDLSNNIQIKEKLLSSKGLNRIYFDLHNARISPSYPRNKKKNIVINSGNLKGIRLGKQKSNTIRVVFDFGKINDYKMFYLNSPFRIVFDIYKNKNIKLIESKPAEKIGKNYSVIRQLGLGVQTIIIDPGHGGKDPGTINKKFNIQEKTITLDLAKRIKKIFLEYPEYKIILTRETDKTVHLEERTAIANSKSGDLFVSIHVNSAKRKTAKGLETFYLSMTTDPWAISVAAKENAVSTKSIREMDDLVKKIVDNAKVSESKVFSKFLKDSTVGILKKNYKNIDDHGVKKAPFYVLVGSNMPSALIEVSFLSNSLDARRLKTENYKNHIAIGIVQGILKYIKSLGKK